MAALPREAQDHDAARAAGQSPAMLSRTPRYGPNPTSIKVSLIGLAAIALCTAALAASPAETPGPYVDAAAEFKLNGDGKTDNYAGFLAWAAHAKANKGGKYWLKKPAVAYFIDRYKQVEGFNEKLANGNEDVIFSDFDGLTILGDDATIAVTGKFHRSADEVLNGLKYSRRWHLCPLAFDGGRNLRLEGLIVKGNVQDTTRDEGVMEWRGHGITIRGTEHVRLDNVWVDGFSVDGIYIDGRFSHVDEKGRSVHRSAKYLVFNNVRATRNGRQGMSIINACFGVFNSCEFSQTGKTGNYGSHAPAAGMDIEPHYGPLGDNRGDTAHIADEWNGFFTFNACRFFDNRGGAAFVTSTSLTRNVAFNACKFEDDKESTGGGYFLTASCQSTRFTQCEFLAYAPNYISPDGAGLVADATGVLMGHVRNMRTTFRDCDFRGPTMISLTQTLPFDTIVLRKVVIDNCRFTYVPATPATPKYEVRPFIMGLSNYLEFTNNYVFIPAAALNPDVRETVKVKFHGNNWKDQPGWAGRVANNVYATDIDATRSDKFFFNQYPPASQGKVSGERFVGSYHPTPSPTFTNGTEYTNQP
jgi:hypothetical protein